MPSWFMLMPSDTEMVVNSRGVPPASATPALAASTWKSWVMLQGVCLALHADHADHRLGDRRVVEPHRAHEGAVRRTIEPVGGHAGSRFFHGCKSLHVVPANVSLPIVRGVVAQKVSTTMPSRGHGA